MPRSKEAFEEMRQKSIQHIMETALRLFSERGYHGTSISMIAKEAGIATGLMYNYFSGKQELLEKIMDENFYFIYTYVTGKTGSPNETGTPVDLGVLIDMILEAINSREASWKLLVSVMFQPDVSEFAKKRIDQFMDHLVTLFLRYFHAMGTRDPETSAKVLSAIFHGAFINYAYSGDSEEIRLLRDTVIRRLLTEGV